MESPDHILEEFDKKEKKGNVKFLLTIILSFASIIVAYYFHVESRQISVNDIANTGSSIFAVQALLVGIFIVFAMKKRIGWMLMAIIAGAVVTVFIKFIFNYPEMAARGDSFQMSIWVRVGYFLLTYLTIAVLLFTESVLNYLSIKRRMIVITLVIISILSLLILIA